MRLYEFEDKAPYLHKLNDGFRSTVPAKGAVYGSESEDWMCQNMKLLAFSR